MEAVTTKRRKSRKKTSVADKVFVTLNTLFMIMFVIITLYPVLNTLAISLNDGTDARRDLPAAEKIYMEKLYYRAAERQPDYGCLHHGCKNRHRNSTCTVCQRDSGIYCQQKTFHV